MVPKYIVIHHSTTMDGKEFSWGNIRNYHVNVNGWDDIGYHFGIEFIRSSEEILAGRMPDIEGAHCQPKGFNHKSIGVCFVGNFDINQPPIDKVNKGVSLVKWLMRTYSIPVDNVLGHREVAMDGRTCPGIYFDMDNFRRLLR